MKKIFTIISSIVVCFVVVFMSVLVLVKTNIPLTYGSPYNINVFNKSTTTINGTSYSSDDEEYDEVLSGLQQITNISIFKRLINGASINDKLEVDIGGKYSSFSTEMMQEYVCVELVFNKEQDVVVYYEGDSKVISYWSIMYVIPDTDEYDEILVYYSNTNESTARKEAYTNCSPIILHGITTKFVEYVNSL